MIVGNPLIGVMVHFDVWAKCEQYQWTNSSSFISPKGRPLVKPMSLVCQSKPSWSKILHMGTHSNVLLLGKSTQGHTTPTEVRMVACPAVCMYDFCPHIHMGAALSLTELTLRWLCPGWKPCFLNWIVKLLCVVYSFGLDETLWKFFLNRVLVLLSINNRTARHIS